MSSAATSVRKEDSAANLAFYQLRDDFVRTYKPVTDEEKLLVVQMARSWQHLQEVHELRNHLTAEKGLLGLFEEDFEKYKLLMRHLTDAERMWRNAGLAFQRARRQAVRSGVIAMARSEPQLARKVGYTLPTINQPPPNQAGNEPTPGLRRTIEVQPAPVRGSGPSPAAHPAPMPAAGSA